MLKLTPEEVNSRYPITGLEFYTRGIKIMRTSQLKKPPPQGRKQAISQLSKSSLSNLAFLAQNTPLELLSMLTLSYGKIYPSSGYHLRESRNRFLTFMRNRYRNLGYIWFLEFQKRGAPHLHMLLDIPVIPEDRELVAARWLVSALETVCFGREYPAWEIADAALKMFRVHRHKKTWEQLREENGARGYVVKYATKTYQKKVPREYADVGRFWSNSRNAKPKPLSTQSASELGVRLYLEAIDHKMAKADILPKHLSTYRPKDCPK